VESASMPPADEPTTTRYADASVSVSAMGRFLHSDGSAQDT
jgi:hypothetical protein